MTVAADEQVLYKDIGNVAVVTLNRPDRHNALSDLMRAGLRGYSRRIDHSSSVGAVVITGNGTSFCSGGDVKEMSSSRRANMSFAEKREAYIHETSRTAQALFGISKPVVAAINGPAIGAGLGIALLADIRIAASTAWFSAPFVRLGLMPDWAVAHLLPRTIGQEPASRLLLGAEPIDAARALQLGLVSEVVEHAALLNRAIDFAAQIASGAPLAVTATKAALVAERRDGVLRALQDEAGSHARLASTADHAEAVRAWTESRSPAFTGK